MSSTSHFHTAAARLANNNKPTAGLPKFPVQHGQRNPAVKGPATDSAKKIGQTPKQASSASAKTQTSADNQLLPMPKNNRFKMSTPSVTQPTTPHYGTVGQAAPPQHEQSNSKQEALVRKSSTASSERGTSSTKAIRSNNKRPGSAMAAPNPKPLKQSIANRRATIIGCSPPAKGQSATMDTKPVAHNVRRCNVEPIAVLHIPKVPPLKIDTHAKASKSTAFNSMRMNESLLQKPLTNKMNELNIARPPLIARPLQQRIAMKLEYNKSTKNDLQESEEASKGDEKKVDIKKIDIPSLDLKKLDQTKCIKKKHDKEEPLKSPGAATELIKKMEVPKFDATKLNAPHQYDFRGALLNELGTTNKDKISVNKKTSSMFPVGANVQKVVKAKPANNDSIMIKEKDAADKTVAQPTKEKPQRPKISYMWSLNSNKA